MIIHRIHADNVLKYTRLRLDDLPEQGLIAITGPNESGKSTIGETLCFALFGRTFSLDYDHLEKVIHWGETHCSVALEFTAKDGERYLLERFLDDAGNHSARIGRVGGDGEPLARGVEKVADKVFELIGYEYEEFIESFYLAQREITTPHPHSYAVKTMAGLVTLEYSANSFQEEVEQMRGRIEETEQEIANLEAQIEELGLDPARLAGQEAQRAEVARQLESLNRQLNALDEASLAYQDALPRSERAGRAAATAGLLRFFSLILALAGGAGWYLLSQLPDHPWAKALNGWLGANIPGWGGEQAAWLLYGAIGFGLLFVLFWLRGASQRRLQRHLADSGRELAQLLDALDSPKALAKRMQALEDQEEPSPEQPGQEAAGEPAGETETRPASEAPASEPVVDRAARQRLSQRVADGQADAAEVRDGVGAEQGLLRDLLNRLRERQGQLDGAIAQERERVTRGEQITGMRDDLAEKNAERQHHIELCELAGELLQGAMREVSHQFNRKLRGLVSKTLPLFTDNRYEHLQIADDLTVRAFSSEKRDFMDLEEISSGTQRQIMLAVRLALAEELVGRAVRSDQFLFLDEPFAFFDQGRTRSSLRVLPTLSEQIRQIWIIGQEFPTDIVFDRHIRCDRAYLTLPPEPDPVGEEAMAETS